LANVILIFIQFYTLIVLARVLMSWIQVDPYSQPARTIIDLTEPVLKPIRDLLPPTAGLDFSPVIAIILLQIIGQILISFVPK
jgi:YggT family protein